MTPKTNVLHLYRSILRETTYLPIPRARDYIKSYASSNFRQHVPKIPNQTSYGRRDHGKLVQSSPNEVFITEQKQTKLLARSRKFLSTLQRANQGYMKPLEKILKMTYARTGKRRRQLMVNLMTPENQEDQISTLLQQPWISSSSSTTSSSITNGRGAAAKASKQDLSVSDAENNNLLSMLQENYHPGWQPPTKVSSLLRSQAIEQGNLDFQKGKIKAKLKLPEKTIWNKPLPTCRIKNLTRKWYAKNTAMLMPPLPDDSERKEIKTLAKNFLNLQPRIIRRTKAKASKMVDDNDEEVEETEEKESSKILLYGPNKNPIFEKYAQGRPHKLTSRFMRRRMAKIFKHVPTVEIGIDHDKDLKKKKKNVKSEKGRKEEIHYEWEQIRSSRFDPIVPDHAQAAALFG